MATRDVAAIDLAANRPVQANRLEAPKIDVLHEPAFRLATLRAAKMSRESDALVDQAVPRLLAPCVDAVPVRRGRLNRDLAVQAPSFATPLKSRPCNIGVTAPMLKRETLTYHIVI